MLAIGVGVEAGARPEDAVAMRVLDARLPAENDEDQWGDAVRPAALAYWLITRTPARRHDS